MNVHGRKVSSYFRSRVADVNSDECALVNILIGV